MKSFHIWFTGFLILIVIVLFASTLPQKQVTTNQNVTDSIIPLPTGPTQADKDRCQIQAQEYAYQQGEAVIAASDAQAKAMGGITLSEGDPTKVGSYQPDLKRAYLNCIDNTNY